MSIELQNVISCYPCKEVSIEITNFCDMRCIHCSSDAGDEWKNELTLDEIFTIINQSKEFLGTEVISLSGGDPILRKDFVDIVKYIDKLDLNILIYSSGALWKYYKLENAPNGEWCSRKLIPFTEIDQYKSIIDIMHKKGNKMIYSLEGGNKFSHEFITRIDDSWYCTIKSIKDTLMENIYTEIHTCPMTTNMYEFEDMYGILRMLGVDRWSFLRLVPQGRCSKVNYLITNKIEFGALLRILAQIKKFSIEDDEMDVRIGDPLNFYECIGSNIMPMTTCSAGKNRILIRANGEAQFCAALKHSPNYDYGNIRNTSIIDLWVNSEIVKLLRNFHENDYRQMRGECGKCKNLEICKGGCLSQRIALYGDIMRGPDPLCPWSNGITCNVRI